MNSSPVSAREFAGFALTWLRAPRRVGAIVPSGAHLARIITAGISRITGRILELGPGTGVFTRALIARGVQEENLTLLESDPHFAQILKSRFPAACVISGCATSLEQMSAFQSGFGAIISGLPLLAMPPPTVERILGGAFRHLQPGKTLYQFTYRPKCPVPPKMLKHLNLEAKLTGFSIRNLPPAWIYAFGRSGGGEKPLGSTGKSGLGN